MISSKTYIALTKFGIVGGISFGIDFSIYYLLSQYIPTYFAKSISTVLATFVNYQLNKRWTWGQKDRDQQRFVKYIALYLVSGLANVGMNELLLSYLPNAELVVDLKMPFIEGHQLAQNWSLLSLKFDKFIALIGATVTVMVLNFIGQKLWVFTEKENK